MALLRFTITGVYPAEPESYEGETDPARMAALDHSLFHEGGLGLADLIDGALEIESVEFEAAT